MTLAPHRLPLATARRRLASLRPGLAGVLALVLLLAQGLGLAHRSAHAPAAPAPSPAFAEPFAGPFAPAPGHAQAHAQVHAHAHAHAHALGHGPGDDCAAAIAGLFGGHDAGSAECRLIDQLGHADALGVYTAAPARVPAAPPHGAGVRAAPPSLAGPSPAARGPPHAA